MIVISEWMQQNFNTFHNPNVNKFSCQNSLIKSYCLVFSVSVHSRILLNDLETCLFFLFIFMFYFLEVTWNMQTVEHRTTTVKISSVLFFFSISIAHIKYLLNYLEDCNFHAFIRHWKTDLSLKSNNSQLPRLHDSATKFTCTRIYHIKTWKWVHVCYFYSWQENSS